MSELEVVRPRNRSKAGKARMRRLVFPRDNWACQDCGLQFTPATEQELSGRLAPWVGWICLELDHIVPYSRGGLFVEANLRALCSTCNRSKGKSTVLVDWSDRCRMARDLLLWDEHSQATAWEAVRILTGGDC